MSHNTSACENVAERVNVMGMLVDETENPINYLALVCGVWTDSVCFTLELERMQNLRLHSGSTE